MQDVSQIWMHQEPWDLSGHCSGKQVHMGLEAAPVEEKERTEKRTQAGTCSTH